MRRPLATALSLTALLLGASACEKPTPAVTLQSGDDSVRTEATRYCEGDDTLNADDDCPGTADGVTVLRVRQGALLNIDVDAELADSGWFLYDSDARRADVVRLNEHHDSFTVDFTGRPDVGRINLEVRKAEGAPRDPQTPPTLTGTWAFQLVQE